MALKTFIEAIRETLAEEMRRDPAVILLGEDVGKKGGVFLATDGLWSEFGDDRVIDTPLSESLIVGASIGAAINGLRPVAEIQFADFIFPAFNQILSEAARMRYRSNNGFAVPMTIRAPYGGGVHGALYHSQSVEAFFAHIPGLKVVIPSTPYDAKGLLRSAIRDNDPVLFLEHKALYAMSGLIPEEEYLVPLGKADIRRAGGDVTIVTLSRMVQQTLDAAETLAAQGTDAEVIDLRSLTPLDKDTIFKSVEKTSRLVIAHEAVKSFGIGAEIAAMVSEEMIDVLDAPVVRVGAPFSPVPFSQEGNYLPNASDIVRAVEKVMTY